MWSTARACCSRQKILASYSTSWFVGDIGKPVGSLIGDGDRGSIATPRSTDFEISFTRAAVEPLIFFDPTGAGTNLLINLDLWLFLKLERKIRNMVVSAQGVEAVRQHVIEAGELETIEILVEYLCKYLQTRQMALLVRHIRRLQISNPPQEMIDRFEEGATGKLLTAGALSLSGHPRPSGTPCASNSQKQHHFLLD